jgi:hypothetical protein
MCANSTGRWQEFLSASDAAVRRELPTAKSVSNQPAL